MGLKREIIFLNNNYDLKDFDIFINGRKVKDEKDIYKRKHIFKTSVTDDSLKVLIQQRHPCESIKSMLFEATGALLLDFLHQGSNLGESRAVFEGEVKGNCNKINVELLKEEKGCKDFKYTFKVFSEDGEIIEERNEFESPKYLKKRMKLLKVFTYLFPAMIPIILVIMLVLFVKR